MSKETRKPEVAALAARLWRNAMTRPSFDQLGLDKSKYGLDCQVREVIGQSVVSQLTKVEA